MIKNKALLPITAPNALIHAKEAYDVCHLWDRQLQMQSNNLFNRLNDKGMLGCSTRVRLQHLQNSFWSGQSITESLFTMKTKRGRSLLNDILVICKIHDLTFKLSKNLNDNLLIKGGNITIEEILDDESQYRLIRKSLRNRQLMLLEQLVSHNGKILLHWQEITNNDRRGPKPGWFKTLENKLLTDTKTRVLSAEMQATLGERYNICNWNIGKQSNSINWVAIQNDEGTHPIIGKKRKMLNKDEFTIQHHTKEVSSQSSGNSVLEKCTGCAQGDRSLVANLKNQDVCLIKTSMAKSVSINVVRSVVSLRSTPDRSNRLRLRSSQNAIRDGISKIIEDSLPVGSIRSIDPPTVYISNNARDRTTMFAKFQNFWTQENIQTKLDDIRSKLSSSMSIRIYTDGSLIKKDNNNSHITTMGCGWCAFDENDTEFNFSGKVENFTSSTRAELMAILTAVYATPKRSRLCIFTDSQAAIDAIASAATNPRKAHRKLKNWTIVKAIEEIANVQNLTLRLEKLADQIIDDVFVQFKLFLHTHIWKDRCTAVKKWETENGISNNKWKKKIRNETRDTILVILRTLTSNEKLNHVVRCFETSDLSLLVLIYHGFTLSLLVVSLLGFYERARYALLGRDLVGICRAVGRNQGVGVEKRIGFSFALYRYPVVGWAYGKGLVWEH
ncbi:hypothetical protein Glove_33g248 [Diversispora epigaea]|uniref:RNase H type-1 domain-containing protein n=1 Tax=Diversispora epigaea TaxID=1348612 RepID=A0A397JIX1_9GLOM|nr:hypothetical protein Glove_33g248 [Diversispora epigaea]